jgi:hypothetical protein
MPALSVALDEEHLLTVATDGFDVLDVGVSGDRLGPERATLRVSGGSYPEGRESQYLIWEDERALIPGDTLSVTFSAVGATSQRGKTIEELHPDKMPTDHKPFVPIEEVIQELKQRPTVFDALAFEFIGPDGRSVQAQTTAEEHGYSFTVLWNSHRPERARVSAHTYTLDSLVAKQNGKYHADAKLTFGQRVAFKVLAPNSTVERDARKNGARPSP